MPKGITQVKGLAMEPNTSTPFFLSLSRIWEKTYSVDFPDLSALVLLAKGVLRFHWGGPNCREQNQIPKNLGTWFLPQYLATLDLRSVGKCMKTLHSPPPFFNVSMSSLTSALLDTHNGYPLYTGHICECMEVQFEGLEVSTWSVLNSWKSTAPVGSFQERRQEGGERLYLCITPLGGSRWSQQYRQW